MNKSFTNEQKEYLKNHISKSFFLSKIISNRFSESLDSDENVYGTSIDDLSREEKIKYELNGLDSWDLIEENAKKKEFPDPPNVFRYKFYGLFYVSPVQNSFMMRCRIPGCVLNYNQLIALSKIAHNWGGGYADITTRGNIQIREIMPENTVDCLIKLNDIGLTAKGSGADNVRNITASPTSGFDKQELLDVLPLAKKMHHKILNNRSLYGLPRKFNISFDSGGKVSVCADTNDIGFYAIEFKGNDNISQGTYFRLKLCGITGHKQLAFDSGLLIKPEECVDVASAMIRVFIENGNRSNRNKSRLKYLIDDIGVDEFLDKVQKKLSFDLLKIDQDKCEELNKKDRQANYGIHPQKQKGLNYVGVVIPVGRMTSEQMMEVAHLSNKYGSGEVRLTVWQNLIIPNIPDGKIEEVKSKLIQIGFHYSTTSISGGLVACTGNYGCKYAASNTKGNAVELAKYLEEKFNLDKPINIHLTGCPHSCAQHYIGDIGLRAITCKENDQKVEGYNVALGGGVDDNDGIGRDIFTSIPFSKIPSLLEKVLKSYLDLREGEESFCEFCRKYDIEKLKEIFI